MFWAVSGKMSYFSALKAGIAQVVCSGSISLEVILWAISLVSVRVLSSAEVIASIVSLVIPSSWCPISVNIHWNRSVVHPSRGVG